MSKKPTMTFEFVKGLWKENPVIAQLLGMCPVLAVTNEVKNGIAMSGAVFFVLTMSAVIISLVRKLIPKQVRIACFIVVIAAFVTIADLVLAAYFPAQSKALGPFVPLIVVNCIILGRMEAFASKNNVGRSIIDALGMSAGFAVAMLLMCTFREVLGAGTWMGIEVLSLNWYDPWIVMILPPGAFFTLGVIIGVSNFVQRKRLRA
jgi:electron transport complex protein RnfE